MTEQFKRDFKGVWVPAALWLNKDLNIAEKFLVLEINSLDNGAGCFASSEYLAAFVGLSAGRVKNILTQLRKRGVISTVKTNGRKRWLRVDPSWAAVYLGNENVTGGFTFSLPETSRKRDHSNKEDSILFTDVNKKLVVDAELLKNARLEYDAFCQRQAGTPARYDGGNTAALKRCLRFLHDAIAKKTPELKSDPKKMRDAVLVSWGLVLSDQTWGKLSAFHQNKIELRQINQNIVEIIKTVKGNTNAKRQEPTIGDLRQYDEL